VLYFSNTNCGGFSIKKKLAAAYFTAAGGTAGPALQRLGFARLRPSPLLLGEFSFQKILGENFWTTFNH
jgi:hypothetical protein